ncbi:MAG: CoA-binding protein [Leptolyngbyaceae bacterium]|nr:CoA-binding protein [Leptolyngbyaceae bacterium]
MTSPNTDSADELKTDERMRHILQNSRAIAVVGHSDRPNRASYQVAHFLRTVGYTVIPVNPLLSTIDGVPCYGSLRDIPTPIDIVNVFRRSEHLAEIVDEAIALHIPTVWAQLGVSDAQAQQAAQEAGLNVIMDRCIKIEHIRLGIAPPE